MKPPRSASVILSALIASLFVGCDIPSGTGGRPIEFELRLESAREPGRPVGSFRTSTGWEVTLSSAYVAIGPVYFYENAPAVARLDEPPTDGVFARLWAACVPEAHAHPGDQHFFGGAVKGEWLGQVVFDALSTSPKSLGRIPGIAGVSRSLSLGLYPPRQSIIGDSSPLKGYHAYVNGLAEKDGTLVPFVGGLSIENEGTLRRVDGVPLDTQLNEQSVITLQLHLASWFDGALFDRLEQAPPGEAALITPTSQVRTAWFLGARGASAFSVIAE